MSGRWIARLMLVVMIVVFFIMFANLQRRLVQINQGSRRAAPTSTR